MSKIMQLLAAIAPRAFALPKHLNLMSSVAHICARCAGLIFTDPDDAVTQREPTSHCGIHDYAPRIDLLRKEDRRERYGLFRCRHLRSGPCATPIHPNIRERYSNHVPRARIFGRLNIQTLGQFRPRRGFALARSHCPAVVPAYYIAVCFDDLWMHNKSGR
jgi:hypothetical protein